MPVIEKWEYKFVQRTSLIKEKPNLRDWLKIEGVVREFEKAINALGEEGWEWVPEVISKELGDSWTLFRRRVSL